MNHLSFTQLHVNNLTINGLYALNKSTIELALPNVVEIGAIPAAILTSLQSANQKLFDGMNKNQKSGFTPEIGSSDKERDSDIFEINRTVSSFSRSSNAVKKSAATELKLFLTPYWNISSLAQDIETGVVAEMLVKFKSQTNLQAAAATLDIDGLFASLETKNENFNALFKDRNAEYAERNSSATTLKPAAITAYIQFCTSIEQAVNFTPNDALITLFNNLDELRKNYHALEDNSEPKEEKVAL